MVIILNKELFSTIFTDFNTLEQCVLSRFIFVFVLNSDERFPSDAIVEFIFSPGPEKIKGWLALLLVFRKASFCTCQTRKEGKAKLKSSPQAGSTTRTTQLSPWTTTRQTRWFAGIPTRTLTSDTRTAWRVMH